MISILERKLNAMTDSSKLERHQWEEGDDDDRNTHFCCDSTTTLGSRDDSFSHDEHRRRPELHSNLTGAKYSKMSDCVKWIRLMLDSRTKSALVIGAARDPYISGISPRMFSSGAILNLLWNGVYTWFYGNIHQSLSHNWFILLINQSDQVHDQRHIHLAIGPPDDVGSIPTACLFTPFNHLPHLSIRHSLSRAVMKSRKKCAIRNAVADWIHCDRTWNETS